MTFIIEHSSKKFQILCNQKYGIDVKRFLTEKLADRKARLDEAKHLRTNEKQIRIPMDNVLLAI